MITIVAPSGQSKDAVFQQNVLSPFSNQAVRFVASFSDAILLNSEFKKYPELMALAFWFRPARLDTIRKTFEEKRAGRFWLGRGLVFHIAPSNVDTVYLYTMFLSLLAGNCNIVRLSSRSSEQQEVLVSVLNELFQQPEHEEIRRRTLIVRYEHDDETTAFFSAHCDVRVLWGGDETIRRLRSIPLPPSAVELPFADRFSFCVLGSRAVLENPQPQKLIQEFYKDAYWFDQMACSSTRLVGWVGSEEDTERAKKLFWPAVEAEALRQGYPLSAYQAAEKLAAEYGIAMEGATVHLEPAVQNIVTRITFAKPEAVNRELHCGSGLFYECRFDSLLDAARLFARKDQTITYLGFTTTEWRAVLEQVKPGGIHRIVPVGKALEFGLTWDGFDLLREFCREIELS